MSRLTIDMTDQQHQALKAMAALQGKSIKEYAMERLFPHAGSEEQALSELRTLLERRLAEANRGEVEARSASEIAEEVIRRDGAM
jgi:hypothetical protein